jgi:hypothetical protein
MEFDEIEFFIAPLKVYWVGMPDDVGTTLKLELLKRDVLLVKCEDESLEDLHERIEDHPAIVLINLDDISQRLRLQDRGTEEAAVMKIIKGVKENIHKRAILHTSYIGGSYVAYARELGIPILEKNLREARITTDLITKISRNVFQEFMPNVRTFLRIQFYPRSMIPVTLNLSDSLVEKVNGNLSDLSLNGMGIRFSHDEESSELKPFTTGSFISIKLFIVGALVRIDRAVIRRRSADGREIGVYFDINDPNMITHHDANILTGFIDRMIDEVHRQMGSTTDLNFLRFRPHEMPPEE